MNPAERPWASLTFDPTERTHDTRDRDDAHVCRSCRASGLGDPSGTGARGLGDFRSFLGCDLRLSGRGRGVPAEKFDALESWVQEGLEPDRTILFDVSVETAQARLHDTRILDRFEREAADFHQRVRDAYHARLATQPDRIRRVASDVPIDEVRDQILAALEDLLN